jgi:hypothetical protein
VQNSQWIDEQLVSSATERTAPTSASRIGPASGPAAMSGASRMRLPVAGVAGAATTSFG